MIKSVNWKEVWQYIILSKNGLYQGTPNLLLIILGSIAAVCLLWVLLSKRVKHKGKAVGMILLVGYVILIYCTTVILRSPHEPEPFNFHLFWSYRAFLAGKNAVMAEKIMNLAVFVPFGLLLECSFRSMDWKKAFLIGCSISISIEVLQLLFYRGCAELDDIFHNTLGCLIGYLIVSIIKELWLLQKRFCTN